MGFDLTGLGSVADFATTVTNKIFPDQMDEAEKQQAKLAIQELTQKRDSAVLDAQKAVMTAELQQGDSYTKRARPTVVYTGLAFIFLVHVAFPITAFFTGRAMPELMLPEEFWWAWTGVCTAWVIGRSAEKRGAAQKQGLAGKLTGLITGSK